MASKRTEEVFEVSLHFIPTLSEKEVMQAYTTFCEELTSQGAELLSQVSPERFSLAFPVRHTVRQGDGTYQRFTESYLGSVKFRAQRSICPSLAAALRSQENVLRFLITETVEQDTRIGTPLPDEKSSAASDQEEGFAVEGSVVEEKATAEQS